MSIYSAYAVRWHPDDDKELREQLPSEATFNMCTLHFSCMAVNNNWGRVEKSLFAIKGVISVMLPCPACPEWQVEVEFEHIPDFADLVKVKQRITKAVAVGFRR